MRLHQLLRATVLSTASYRTPRRIATSSLQVFHMDKTNLAPTANKVGAWTFRLGDSSRNPRFNSTKPGQAHSIWAHKNWRTLHRDNLSVSPVFLPLLCSDSASVVWNSFWFAVPSRGLSCNSVRCAAIQNKEIGLPVFQSKRISSF